MISVLPKSKSMATISFQLIKDQVKNTAPFLPKLVGEKNSPYVQYLLQSDDDQNAFSEFRLCLSAHFATVGTYVPTDVDNLIRQKLWSPHLDVETLNSLVDLVIESLQWNVTKVTTRRVRSPLSQREFSGHEGEWFSTAVAAYSASKKKIPEKSEVLMEMIEAETKRQGEIFVELKSVKSGIEMLKASYLIAHNLGDLDRVIDLWHLASDDPLRKSSYKLGHEAFEKNSDHWKTGLYQAGILNKLFMAAENHRHFALREARCLRKSADLLLPIGPFLDDWGRIVARHPELSHEEIAGVIETLVLGWERLPQTHAYPRAICGILDVFPGGRSSLSQHLPAKVQRTLRSGPLASLLNISQKRFEEHWAARALKALL